MAADGSVIIEIKGDYDEFLADLEKALKKSREKSKKSNDPLEKQRKSTQLTVKELQNLDSVASKALRNYKRFCPLSQLRPLEHLSR